MSNAGDRGSGIGNREAGSRKRVAGSFDVAIDRAVREMLDVEQPAGLRGRVLRQLTASGSELPASGSATRFRLPALGFGVAVAAALILAVLAPWRTQPPAPVVSAPPRIAVTPPPSAPPLAPQPGTAVSETSPPRAARSGSVPPPVRIVAPSDRLIAAAGFIPPEPVGEELEPLRTITPIQMTPIAEQRFAPAEIALRPLNTITDVQIAPLTPPERRN